MNIQTVIETSEATLTGSLDFPAIVQKLIGSGVESYYVDYVSLQTTYYGDAGDTVTTAICYDDLPKVASAFDPNGLRAAIFDSQQNGQAYRDFTTRAMSAGVQGYLAFLRGKRVTYWGRGGDQHTEWFPGADPARIN